jgi:hypothetical protein
VNRVLDFLAACPAATFEHAKLAVAQLDNDCSFFDPPEGTRQAYISLAIEQKITPWAPASVGRSLGVSLPPPVFTRSGGTDAFRDDWRKSLDALEQACEGKGVAHVQLNLIGLNGDEAEIAQWQLRRRGYFLLPFEKLMIDLRAGPAAVRRQMNKGHRADISRWDKSLQVEFVGKDNPEACAELFNRSFVVTHPNAVQCYNGLIRHGLGEVCLVRREGVVLGGALLSIYRGYVEYLDAFRIVEDEVPVHTVAVWRAIERFAAKGFEQLDLGVVIPASSLHVTSDAKKLSIAKFKRNLGGRIQAFPVFERFFDLKFAEWMLRQRAENVLSSLSEERARGT